MRWTSSWWPRFRSQRLSVVGLDMGPEACSLVVLSGTAQAPDTVCCAERLNLPEDLWVSGEVRESEALGKWLQAYLVAGDYPVLAAYVGLTDACITQHMVTLTAGLSDDDVAFQLLVEVQAELPAYAADVCLDYTLDAEIGPAGEQRYVVQAAPRSHIEALQRVLALAGVKVMAIEPRHEAACRTCMAPVLGDLPPASVALGLQCNEAFGLALRAWCAGGINFLPYRQEAQHVLRRAWLLGIAVCAMGGAILAAGFSVAMAWVAEHQQPTVYELRVSAHALDEAQHAYAKAKAQQDRRAAQAQWVTARQALQAQSLQWSRVLSQSAQGVWVASVQQQGTRWTVHGEALSAGHAQQLVVKLKALDVWAHAPELPQLQVAPVVPSTGLLVWQFRIEANLKVGV